MKINRKALGNIFFLIGWGITLHAIADELFHKGGLREILSFQGEWFGLSLIMIGWILLNLEHIIFKNIKKETQIYQTEYRTIQLYIIYYIERFFL